MPRNEFFRDFIVTSPEGIWVDGRAYATLNAAVAAVGANEQTIVIASEQVITTITIPINVTLKFERNGSISNSAAMIILTTKIIAPNRQIFTGVGNIAFSFGSELRSSWFASFEEAVTRIAHADVTLVVSEPRLVAANCTVGAYTSLKWESPNAMLTVNPGTTVDGLQHIEAGSFQLFAGAGTFTFDDHCQLKLSWFPRLRSAITWIDTSEVVLHIDGTHIVDFSDTAPYNISFDFKTARGHIEVLVGLILVIKGDVYGGFFRIFSGDGTVICPRGFSVTAVRMTALLGGTLNFGDIWPGTVSLQGFADPGDGGGGDFYWDSLELKDNHDGGTIIDPHHTAFPGDAAWYAGVGIGGVGCWKRDSDNEERNVKWFGATGDGVLSDRLFILSAINSISGGGQVYFPPGTYIIDSSLDISAHTDINFSFSGGASLSLSVGVTLTLPSPSHIIASPMQELFVGAGTVAFAVGGKISPGWYGAIGDGVTDNASAFDRMGRSVRDGIIIGFEPGHYVTSETLDPPLVGHGSISIVSCNLSSGYGDSGGDGVIIEQTDPLKDVINLSATSPGIRRRCIVQDIRLIGGKWGIYADRITHTTIERVYIRGSVSGIYINYGWGNRIDNCRIEAMTGDYGIHAESASNSLQITRNYISGIVNSVNSYGILVQHSGGDNTFGLLAQGNIVESCSNGMKVVGRGGVYHGNYFENNTLSDFVIGDPTASLYVDGITFSANQHAPPNSAGHITYRVVNARRITITRANLPDNLSSFLHITDMVYSTIKDNAISGFRFIQTADIPTTAWSNIIDFEGSAAASSKVYLINAIRKSILFWTQSGVGGSNTVTREPATWTSGSFIGKPVLNVLNFDEAAGVGVSHTIFPNTGLSNLLLAALPISAYFDVRAPSGATVRITLEGKTIDHVVTATWQRIGITSYYDSGTPDNIHLQLLNMSNSNKILYVADTPQIIVGINRHGFDLESLPFLSTGSPTVGGWRRGDIVWGETPSAGGTIGWVCTASGIPGTWKTFGTIAA